MKSKYIRRKVGKDIVYVCSSRSPHLLRLSADAARVVSLAREGLSIHAISHIMGCGTEEIEGFLKQASSMGLLNDGVVSAPQEEARSQESASEVTNDLFSIAEEQRIPISGTFELTGACNLRCLHCYLGESHPRDPNELGLEDWEKNLRQLVANGCLWISITGGDPLLSPKFMPIYRLLNELGVMVTVLTNGTTMTPELVELFRELPPYKISVSLYGATEATYETVTRVKGSYKKCLEGIAIFRDLGLNLGLKAIALQENVHEFEAIRAFASEIGAHFMHTGEIHPSYAGESEEPLKHRLPVEKIAELDHADDSFRLSMEMAFCDIHAPKSNKLYQCVAGRSGFHLDPLGKMHICHMDLDYGQSLAELGFREIWDKYFPKVLSATFGEEDECMSCTMYSMCKVCPPRSKLFSGQANQPVPLMCQLVRERIALISKEGR